MMPCRSGYACLCCFGGQRWEIYLTACFGRLGGRKRAGSEGVKYLSGSTQMIRNQDNMIIMCRGSLLCAHYHCWLCVSSLLPVFLFFLRTSSAGHSPAGSSLVPAWTTQLAAGPQHSFRQWLYDYIRWPYAVNACLDNGIPPQHSDFFFFLNDSWSSSLLVLCPALLKKVISSLLSDCHADPSLVEKSKRSKRLKWWDIIDQSWPQLSSLCVKSLEHDHEKRSLCGVTVTSLSHLMLLYNHCI